MGAINRAEQEHLEERQKKALDELVGLQAIYQTASDPALRFLALLRGALAGGAAHAANRQGKAPESPETWGWRPSSRGWRPQGTRIGWVASSDLFLDPIASYQLAQQMAGNHRLPISEQTLRHRLHQHGLLASIDTGRKMLMVRRTLEDIPRQVMHLKSGEVVGFEDKSDRSSRSPHCRICRICRIVVS